jgi:hypothetical protein
MLPQVHLSLPASIFCSLPMPATAAAAAAAAPAFCCSLLFTRSGVFGSGLVTLSRHAIVRHGFWRYAAGGFATNIGCGDYYAGKGALGGGWQSSIVEKAAAASWPVKQRAGLVHGAAAQRC